MLKEAALPSKSVSRGDWRARPDRVMLRVSVNAPMNPVNTVFYTHARSPKATHRCEHKP